MDGSPSRGKPFAFVFAFMRFGAPQVIEIRGSRSVQTQGQLGEDKEGQLERTRCLLSLGETIPIRLFLGGFDLTPTFRDVNMKFSTRYYLSLVLIDEGTLMWLHAPMMYLSPISLHLGAEPIACNLSHKCMRWCLSTFLTANFPLSNPSIAVGN